MEPFICVTELYSCSSIQRTRSDRMVPRCWMPCLSNTEVSMTASAPAIKYLTTSTWLCTPRVAPSDALRRPNSTAIHIRGSRIS